MDLQFEVSQHPNLGDFLQHLRDNVSGSVVAKTSHLNPVTIRIADATLDDCKVVDEAKRRFFGAQ